MTAAMCGSCDAGTIHVDYCTCEPADGEHWPHCEWLPCPNGCMDRLIEQAGRGTGLRLLALLDDADEVLVSSGLLHATGCDHCPNDAEHRMSAGHVKVTHLPRCPRCFPQGRAA